MLQLRPDVIETVKSNMDCRNKLAYELRKSDDTIKRYLERNDIMLTTATALDVIADETKIPQDQLLQQEPAQA